MKQAILVLGMHRSGTSSLAGALAHLGAAAPATLMPEHPDNPKGYWESLPLVQTSDHILHTAGSSWSDWRPWNQQWRYSATGVAVSTTLPDLIASEFKGQPLISFKDPRLCRLFPIWDEALRKAGYQPLVISPLRSPIEVAASLSKRDGFSEARALLLWLRHVLDAEAATRQTPRHFVYWSDFLQDWRAELAFATERLGTVLPTWSDSTAEVVDRFLDSQLRRAVHDRDLPSHTPEWVKVTWEALKVLHKDPGASSAQNTLDDIRKQFDETARIYGPVLIGLEGERLSWSTELQANLGALDSELCVSRARILELEQQMDALKLELAATAGALHHAETENAGLRSHMSEQIQILKAESDASSVREIQLQAQIEALDLKEAEWRCALTDERSSSSAALAELEAELRNLREVERNRFARNPFRRWMKPAP